MMRWLVTGAGGMLGTEMVAALRQDPSCTVTAATRSDCDLLDERSVRAAVTGHRVVVNAAGWTAVDAAEDHEAEATAVNGAGVRNLARACAQAGAVLLHLSTDYVFSGQQREPYLETAPTDPINAYGRSKLVGEQAVLAELPDTGYVVRTAWLYGEHGTNFVKAMLHLASTQETVRVVDDQVGQPTSATALAQRLIELGARAVEGGVPSGCYHATASGQTTWCGFAKAVFSLAGFDPARVLPTTTAEYPRRAARPASSVLGHARWAEAGLPPMADWRAMLGAAGWLKAPPTVIR